MVVKQRNYNILENIFTALKKLSIVTLGCCSLIAFCNSSTLLAAPKKANIPTVGIEVAPKTEKTGDVANQKDSNNVDNKDAIKEDAKAREDVIAAPSESQSATTEKPKEENPAPAPVALAKGNADTGKALTTTCVACHGADGNSPIAIYPKLAGQHEKYLLKTLLAYQALKDPSSEKATHKSTNAQIMYSQVMNFSQQDLADLAAFFGSQTTSKGETTPSTYELGRKLYLGGDLERGIPACAACHSPAGLGNDLADFPKLSGQHSEFIKAQLLAFKNDERINEMMQIVAKKLTDEEMAAVSSYASGLH